MQAPPARLCCACAVLAAEHAWRCVATWRCGPATPPPLPQFAGTRYRKRGVNDAGAVANDVETEQVQL